MGSVLVLGCGPAGLLAAHAGRLAGHEVKVISRKQKSRIGGAQYLHHHIPELTPEEPQGWLQVLAFGSKEGYAAKVYGDPEAPVSWDLFVEREDLDKPIPVWDIVDLYEVLWQEWESKIIDGMIGPGLMHQGFILGGWADFDFIVSTIPLPAICQRDHEFQDQRVAVSPVWVGDLARPTRDDVHQIIYNGEPDDSWYRSSWIFDRAMTEWSMNGVKDPEHMFDEKERKLVIKPLTTDCDCWPQIIRAGRYGKWSKGDLVTDAFDEVFDAIS